MRSLLGDVRGLGVQEGLVLVDTQIDGTQKLKLSQWLSVLPALNERSVEKRRNEFYAGRLCAAQAIYKLSGERKVPEVSLDRSPVWPAGTCGSISHTDSWAVSVVASANKYRGIGIDLESVQALPSEPEWKPMIASAPELEACSSMDEISALALLFSAKESLFKALNPLTGVFFDFLDARLERLGSDCLDLVLCRSLDEQYRSGCRFRVQFSFVESHVFTWVVIKA